MRSQIARGWAKDPGRAILLKLRFGVAAGVILLRIVMPAFSDLPYHILSSINIVKTEML
jgi:hypothetical protein